MEKYFFNLCFPMGGIKINSVSWSFRVVFLFSLNMLTFILLTNIDLDRGWSPLFPVVSTEAQNWVALGAGFGLVIHLELLWCEALILLCGAPVVLLGLPYSMGSKSKCFSKEMSLALSLCLFLCVSFCLSFSSCLSASVSFCLSFLSLHCKLSSL